MLKWLKERLTKGPEEIKPTGRILSYNKYSIWGNSIEILNWEQNSFCCWLTPVINVGDEIRFKMESGSTKGFLVNSVEYCDDPKDMAFFSICSDPVFDYNENKQ